MGLGPIALTTRALINQDEDLRERAGLIATCHLLRAKVMVMRDPGRDHSTIGIELIYYTV